ncbi:MAG TPA: glycosyltransferase family 39 protein, partial [Anaerolineae bacterium]
MKSTSRQYAALVLILVVAAFFRLYGLAWDSGYLFHPDERKIVLVAAGLAWPADLLTFLSSESPLNPKFFAYGSFPIYLLRALSALAPAGSYGVPWREDYFVSLVLLGRVLSALFDLGTIALIFFLGRRLYDATLGLFASACVAVAVLHIQLSHFYAVDTLLTLLVTATVLLAARLADTGSTRDAVWTGIGLGL